MGDKNRNRLTIVLLVVYLLLIIGVVLFKLPFYSQDYHTERVVNLIPLMGSFTDNGVIVWHEIWQNILIFIPLGIYACMLGFKHKLGLIIGVTFALEVIQFACALGVADITDVIANTLGGIAGIGIYSVARRLLKRRSGKVMNIGAIIATICVLVQFTNLFYLSHFAMGRNPGEITLSPSVATTEPLSTHDILLVNANNPLPDDYRPQRLVNLHNQSGRHFELMSADIEICETVFTAMEQMFTAAQASGVDGFIITSGYRTYAEQQKIYKTTMDGIALPPGCSEHEAGLAFDVGSVDSDDFESTPQFDWLFEHCAEYGFILRYPPGKEQITGIPYEPWHYRYVGIDAATEIMASGLTLEEYLGAAAMQ
jgi:LAS superfamily LD-carboxypeptidase LdcB/glycopeptide antibiotics resistance protein